MLSRAIARQGVLLLLGAAAAIGQGPTPRATIRYTGHAVDEKGTPIAGAAVRVADFDGFVDVADLLAHPPQVTAADGAFAVAAARTSCRIVVATADRQACALRVFASFGSVPSDLGYVVLVPGGKLVGRVRDDTGAPLGGVRVTAVSSIPDLPIGNVQANLLSGAVSDDKGIFVVPCVPRTGLRIRAAADGFGAESRLAAQHTPLDLRLHRTGIVRGKVVDRRGAAVAGAKLYAVTVEMQDHVDWVSSAADGTFALTAPDVRRFRVVGGDEGEPHRQFASALLRGPADDIVVAAAGTDADGPPPIEVEVVAADGGERLPRFFLSSGFDGESEPALQLSNHFASRHSYEGPAQLRYTRPEFRPTRVVVDAPGRAFAIVDVPAELDGPLRVALEPEAVLGGCVRDATTNEPMRGVAVRALPKGAVMSNGGTVEDYWPRTDADGRYRMGGLRPGDYQVQAYAPDRPSSRVGAVLVEANVANVLDLVVPAERWIAVEAIGEVPASPPCFVRLCVGTVFTGELLHGFEVASPDPGPQRLAAGKVYRFGPLGNGGRNVELWVPSRTRACAGITIDLGLSEADGSVRKVALPPLGVCQLRGHVDLTSDVATERIGVIARPSADKRNAWQRARSDAALDGDANFALDLPAGSYRLQLVDLETGIAFHTEPADLAVTGAEQRIALRPELHWLEIAIVPAAAGETPTLRSIRVDLPRSADGQPALLNSFAMTPDGDSGEVEVLPHASPLRWLVPARSLRIHGVQNFDILRRGARGWATTAAGEATLDVSGTVTRATLTVPSPPSDEQLESTR